MTDIMRTCTKCRAPRPLAEFPEFKSGKRRFECRDCGAKRKAEWRLARQESNPTKSEVQEFVEANREELMATIAERSFISPCGCWEWTGAKLGNRLRYGQLTISVNDRSVAIGVHRLVAMLWHGLLVADSKMFACHKCDNPGCCNPEHIFLGTAKDNCDDMVRKGRGKVSVGSHNGLAKLSEPDVSKIKDELCSGARCIDLSRKYGVSFQIVWSIKAGKTWRHVNPESVTA